MLIHSKENISELFDQISSTYDLTNKILSFGMDKLWRRAVTKKVPSKPNQIAIDIATGTADQIIDLFRSPSIKKCYGIDLSKKMLLIGQKKLIRKGLLENVHLRLADAQNLPINDQSCDLATNSFGLRNLPDPLKGLSEMYRVLKPAGVALILEFSLPSSVFVRPFYLTYLRHILPKIGGLLSKNAKAYPYLNKTIESFPFGSTFLQLMKQAGFKRCKQFPLTLGIATLYQGMRE